VNNGREFKYRTKKVDFEAVFENCKEKKLRRTINIILYSKYYILYTYFWPTLYNPF